MVRTRPVIAQTVIYVYACIINAYTYINGSAKIINFFHLVAILNSYMYLYSMFPVAINPSGLLFWEKEIYPCKTITDTLALIEHT